MKKLMITAAAAAMASATFAAPNVYDYKASVKYLDLKEVNVRFGGELHKVYQKVQKSATLKGYLIQDKDGATSPTISNAEAEKDKATAAVPCGYVAADAKAKDQGRNRCFLVVQNPGALPRATRTAKILPAVLDAKWLDTKFTGNNPIAEGILFVGGDLLAKSVRPKLELLADKDALPTAWDSVLQQAPDANKMTAMYNSYGWTSAYLFGQYNGPQWNANLFWDKAQTAIFKEFKDPFNNDYVQQPTAKPFYHDTWMNHTGIGKTRLVSQTTQGLAALVCCGMSTAATPDVTERWYVLESLAGNLKGGLFICTENGFETAPYKLLDNSYWEDQFYTPAITRADVAALTPIKVDVKKTAWCDGTIDLDLDQADVWTDGDVELNTTDVIYGTWSIKLNTKFFNTNGAYDRGAGYTWRLTNVFGQYELQRAIAGAARTLNAQTTIYNGVNIPDVAPTDDRFSIPMVTPDFDNYYFGTK